MTVAAVADHPARDFLRNADPVLARMIDARPDFRPRGRLDDLPRVDAFMTLIVQIVSQQLSISSTRAIVSHIEQRFGGRLPSPDKLLASNPHVLREAGLSARKSSTLRALAERFVAGDLSNDTLARMTDHEIESALTEVSGIGPSTAHGFLLVALNRPDVLLPGDLALRHVVQRAYRLDHTPSEAEMVEIAERWRPYRSLAVSYLFASEFGAARRPASEPPAPAGLVGRWRESRRARGAPA
jgi:DNA-3-methyladenine glycosylase II